MIVGYLNHQCPKCDERRAIWQDILGGGPVVLPIESVFPKLGRDPQDDALLVVCYRLALERLTRDQRARLVARVMLNTGLSESEVVDDLDGDHGCPLEASGMTIEVQLPADVESIHDIVALAYVTVASIAECDLADEAVADAIRLELLEALPPGLAVEVTLGGDAGVTVSVDLGRGLEVVYPWPNDLPHGLPVGFTVRRPAENRPIMGQPL